MIEIGTTFWIMLGILWMTGAAGVGAGMAWGIYRERCKWNDLIDEGKIPAPINEPLAPQ